MIHKFRASASVVSWNWEKCSCRPKTGFNLVNVAVVCAVSGSISGLEPFSVITEPKYLKLVTLSSFCPFTVIPVMMPLVLIVCHQLGLLGTDLHAVGCGDFVEMLNYFLLVFHSLLLSHRCHQQSGVWWLFCLQC